MGYLKRKRTKRRGKKGTKKYRGGASTITTNATNATTATTDTKSITNKFTEEPSTDPPANAGADQKEGAKNTLNVKMTALKTLYDEGPTTKLEIETIKDAMSKVSEALDAYNSFLE